MGGQLLNWMDITSAISANRHCRRVVVTAAVNNVSFDQPIRLGDMVTIEAKVSRAFTSSMEVFMEVFVEDNATGKRSKSNEAMYTFVAVDQRAHHGADLVPEVKSSAVSKAPPPPSTAPDSRRKNKPADTNSRPCLTEDVPGRHKIRCGDTRWMHGVRCRTGLPTGCRADHSGSPAPTERYRGGPAKAHAQPEKCTPKRPPSALGGGAGIMAPSPTMSRSAEAREKVSD